MLWITENRKRCVSICSNLATNKVSREIGIVVRPRFSSGILSWAVFFFDTGKNLWQLRPDVCFQKDAAARLQTRPYYGV